MQTHFEIKLIAPTFSYLQIWARHYFVLTNEKLFFTEQQEKEEEPEKEDETEVGHVTW